MFDVSWEDPTMETVGQRRNRIEHDQNTATPGIRRASTSSDSPRLNTAKSRPSILTLLLNGSRKDFSRPASRARLSAPEREPVPELPRSRAGRVGNTISHIQELPPGTLTSDVLQDRFVVTEFPGSKSRDNYSPADGACLSKHFPKLINLTLYQSLHSHHGLPSRHLPTRHGVPWQILLRRATLSSR